VKLEFEGSALQTPANRDLVEHLAKVLKSETEAYVASHGGGDVSFAPPVHQREEVSVEGIGAAGAGWSPERYTKHRALVSGSVHLNSEG
jgi:Fe-S cluster biogenesis protein NfuA